MTRSFIIYIIKIIKSRRMRQADHVAPMGNMKNAYKISVGKPEEKRQLGRLEDNIKINVE
jgi:hypothetical protein